MGNVVESGVFYVGFGGITSVLLCGCFLGLTVGVGSLCRVVVVDDCVTHFLIYAHQHIVCRRQ